jgi:uncharacterized membrane protein YuzA (DUF378 family)
MQVLYKVALVLVLIGGLNWGLVGFFDYNLVDMLFGEGSTAARVVYSLVGLATVFVIIEKLITLSKTQKV